MMHETGMGMAGEHHHHCTCKVHCFRRLSWSAVIVGALVAVGLGFLLNLFSFAIGLSALTMSKSGAITWAVGGVIGLFIVSIVSMLGAGFAAGYLGRSHCPGRHHGLIYGFTTWSLALLLSASAMNMVGHYVEASSHALVGSNMVVTQSPDQKTTSVTVGGEPVSQPQQKMTTPTENIAYGAFILFALFFVGAISACVGACCGLGCHHGCHHKDEDVHTENRMRM